LSYPGLCIEVKWHLWRSVCLPTLVYGFDSIHVTKSDLSKLESTQGIYVKKALGISKFSHHSAVLSALNIDSIHNVIRDRTLNMYYRIYQNNTPVRDFCNYMLANFISSGKTIKGTIIDRILEYGFSPVSAAFVNCSKITYYKCAIVFLKMSVFPLNQCL